jgi:adenine-specific DNA-methyltransferase
MRARPRSQPQAPALIADLVARAQALAGAGADSGARRGALLRALREWIPDADELALCADGYDVPGAAYEALISGAERRDAGQFGTPHYAADLMAAWLLQEPVKLLLDPAVGSGRLLYRAGIREPAPERMLGLDVDALAVELAQLNLAWRRLGERSEVRPSDFLLATLPEEGDDAARPDTASVNPPYSRHHSIPAEAKAAIHDGFERRLGVKFSRLAALHALFLVRTIEVCAPGARIAFITPGDWLDTAYGRAIKQWVLAQARVEGLVFFPEDARVFGGSVMSSAVITLLRKHAAAPAPAPPSPQKTRVVRLSRRPPAVERVLAALTGSSKQGMRVEEVALAASAKWSRPTPKGNGGTPLSELARVRRGIATGNNAYFVLSEATRREFGLPLDELRPCASSPRVIEGLELFDLDSLPERTPRWVLACWRADAEAEDSPLGAYLRHGRELGVPNGYLASKRSPWHGLDKREPPALLWPYFNRANLRFVRNRAAALPLNTWLGLEPHEDVDADKLWHVLNQPATLAAFLASRRSYAGMNKHEPSELGAVCIRWRKQTP